MVHYLSLSLSLSGANTRKKQLKCSNKNNIVLIIYVKLQSVHIENQTDKYVIIASEKVVRFLFYFKSHVLPPLSHIQLQQQH